MSADCEPYFKIITDDVNCPDRWFLDEPLTEDGEEIDAREFTYGVAYEGPRPCTVPIQVPGRHVAFNLAAFDMPVASTNVADAIHRIAPRDIERFPVIIDSHVMGYEILNVIRTEACVDEGQSEVMKWAESDGRPDKTGAYRMVTSLVIDPKRTHGRDIFRIKEWDIALIVSERLKNALEQSIEDLGIEFRPVVHRHNSS